jgi:hypothetical protein
VSRRLTPGDKPSATAIRRSDEMDNTLNVYIDPSGEVNAQFAQQMTRPSVRAALTIRPYSKNTLGALGVNALVDELSKQCTAVINNDMKRPEAMLIAQAHTLEAIFHELARLAASNVGEHLGAAETFMRLALKAQSQCRATIETLSVIKNPPAAVSFVKQANIAHGPQQVNNGTIPLASRAGDSEIQQSRLLGATNGERLDIGATTAARSADPPLEAVGALNRTAHEKGKGASGSQ